MTLNLNPVMSIIANVPAAVASTVRTSVIRSHSSLILYLLDCSLSCRPPLSQFLSNKRGDVLVGPFDSHSLFMPNRTTQDDG